MKLCSAALALTLTCGAAFAQVAQHDAGGSITGGAFVGPISITPGPVQRGGGVVYDSSIETGFRASAGTAGFVAGAPADGTRVLFDDVPIPASTLGGGTVLDVQRVTVGIRRLARAGATAVSVYWSTMTTSVVAPDTQLDTPPSTIGTVSLDATDTAGTTLVTFGSSGGPTLFSVPLNMDMFTDFGTFGIGVGISNTDGLNGWRLTAGPSPNANVFWLYDPNHSALATDEGAFLFSSADPPNPFASFYIIVEGTPVPAPSGAVALLGLGGCMTRRRRH